MPEDLTSPEGGYESLGKKITILATKTVRYAVQLSLAENTTWYSPVFDCEGFTSYGAEVINSSSSPAAIASATMLFSPNSDFSTPPENARITIGTPSPGSVGALSTPNVILGRYARVRLITGSTAGTYTVTVYLTLNV